MLVDAERELIALIIGYQVREARRQNNMSQSDLSHGVGSQSMISLIEGGRQIPPHDVLHFLANKLSDESLQEFANLLRDDKLTLEALSASNQAVLLEVLRTRRGRWNETHGNVALQLSHHYYILREFDTVLELCKLIIERIPERHPVYAEACFLYGSACLFKRNFEQAEEWLQTAEACVDPLSSDVQGRLYYNMGYLYTVLDFQGLALWYAKCAVDIFHRISNFPRYGKALGLLGTIQHRTGKLKDAQTSLELAYDIGTKWGMNSTDVGRIQATLSWIYASEDQLTKAEEWAHNAIQSSTEANDSHARCNAMQTLFLVHLRRGDNQSAIKYLEESTKFALLTKDVYCIAQAHIFFAVHMPNMEDRIQAARLVYDVTKDSNLLMEHALAADYLSQLYAEVGDMEESTHYGKGALKSYREYTVKNSMFRSALQKLPPTPAL